MQIALSKNDNCNFILLRASALAESIYYALLNYISELKTTCIIETDEQRLFLELAR